jgi:hypothetical protein
MKKRLRKSSSRTGAVKSRRKEWDQTDEFDIPDTALGSQPDLTLKSTGLTQKG